MLKAMLALFNSGDHRFEMHDFLAAIAFAAVIGFEGWALWRGQQYDVSAFGEALGIVLGGGAAGAVGTRFLRCGFRAPPIAGGNAHPDDPDGR